jgi:hypothetical protein
MRKFLFIVAMLLLVAVPAMATVTIRAQQHQPTSALGKYDGGRFCNAIDINYTCSGGERIRAFALELTLDPASGFTFSSIDTFKVGDSNTASKGFGIFPGKFRDLVDAGNPDFTVAGYNPIAPAADADATGTGLGTNKVILELGSLFVADINRPASTGTLCRLYVDVNKPGLTGFGPVSGNFTFGGNATRGGIVLEDGTTVASPTYVAQGRAALGVFSLQKTFPCWQPYDVQFNEWISVWEPRCWAGWQVGDANWRVQCQGDADNKAQDLAAYRVYNSDYNFMICSWGLKATFLRANPNPRMTLCADFDHKKQDLGAYRVYNSDYTVLIAGWGKKVTQMRPWCPLP